MTTSQRMISEAALAATLYSLIPPLAEAEYERLSSYPSWMHSTYTLMLLAHLVVLREVGCQ